MKLHPVFGWLNFGFRLHVPTNLLLEENICSCKAVVMCLQQRQSLVRWSGGVSRKDAPYEYLRSEG
jgi:hypothetical protein